MKAKILVLLILCWACSPKLIQNDQGLKGQLIWLEGDMMPGPDKREKEEVM